MPRRLVQIALSLLSIWLVFALYLFVWPRRDRPHRAAAIIVLAGDEEHRLPRALELARSGVAPVLVVSDGARSDWAPARELCAQPRRRGFRVVCFRPAPYSTRGEARGALRLVERYHWRSLLVVTSTYHVYRSRLLFERCLGGRARVYVSGSRSSRAWLPLNMASETFKLGLAETLRRGC
ncbi:MAG: YdcF family protein [Gaiellaceae bacterium]